jgi:phosphoglycerate dehydrogenase-like enzyme
MKIALLCNRKKQFYKVFDKSIIDRLLEFGEISECIDQNDLEKNSEYLAECEVAFSTWGMLKLTSEQIKKYLPKLKVVFYAAGTVQYFAKPFLENGIRVFSAASANGVPVAEYVFAQIALATKGYFQSAKFYRPLLPLSATVRFNCCGNYKAKIGIVGLGAIGSMVAEKLKILNVEVYACDPFASEEKAEKLNVKLTDIETIFRECDVISNHLPNKVELHNYYNGKLFKLMKKAATFINTGRGAQVKESALACALLSHPKRTAVVDVIKSEFCPILCPLWWCPNVVMTPHIAGSLGNEVVRMAEYMLEEFDSYNKGNPTKHEVTLEILKTMA